MLDYKCLIVLDKEASMEKFKLGEMETRLAELIWANAPLSTKSLVAMCEKEFNWKRTTTYTMLNRLCRREIFENRDSTVYTVMSKEQFNLSQGQIFIDNTFGGSVPMFINLFSKNNRLTGREIDEIQRIIDEYRRKSDD